VQFIKFVIRK